MRKAIRQAVLGGLPLWPSAAGFLYLHEALRDEQGSRYEMAGVIPGLAALRRPMERFGYVTVTAREDSLLFHKGDYVRGHEFHYWQSDNPGGAFRVEKPAGGASWAAGHGSPSLYAGFPHLYWRSPPGWRRISSPCAQYGAGRAHADVRLGNAVAFCAGFLLDLAFGDPWSGSTPSPAGVGNRANRNAVAPGFSETPQGELWPEGSLRSSFRGCVLRRFSLCCGLFSAPAPHSPSLPELLNWQLLSVNPSASSRGGVPPSRRRGPGGGAAGGFGHRGRIRMAGRGGHHPGRGGNRGGKHRRWGVAPLLFLALGGAPLGLLYKAVNTWIPWWVTK